MTDIFNIAVRDFLRTSIGFTKAFDAFEYGPFGDELTKSFPHYNIKSLNNKTNTLELALAGYDVSELDIVENGGSVTITGGSFLHPEKVLDMKTNEPFISEYGSDEKKVHKFEKKLEKHQARCIHNGVAKRGFERTFMLSPGCKVSEATFKNGMLSIKIVDETKYEKAKKIKIKT